MVVEDSTAETRLGEPFVVAIVPTYKRKRELAAVLELVGATPGVAAVVVADDAADPEVRTLFDCARLSGNYLAMETNRGPGPAINRAIRFAREKWEAITHYLILDDDVRFDRGALKKLLAALADNNAQLVAPMITSPSGAVFAWPELKSRKARRFFAARDRNDPARFGEGIRSDNLPQIQACLATFYLMERICYESVGALREDFWLLGEDVEFTARVCRKFRAVFCPHVAVEHFWGSPFDPRSVKRSAYLKACAAVQNNLFLLLHLLPTRFVLRSFIGSLKRFLQLHLRSREAVYDLLYIIWHASVGSEPAGARAGQLLRQRRSTYEPR